MTMALPSRVEAHQLLRLRSLRVQRAREGVRDAQVGVDAAAAVVFDRERRIQAARDRIDALQRAVVGPLAPRLPRWSTLAAAQREALAEQLEREEFALIDDEHALEEAHEKLQQARAVLTRALAREDAVRGVTDETWRARRRQLESRADRELEDLSPSRGKSAC
ncbi:MAG: hypothetical protein ABI696_00305 [Rubrivivax sp.]